MRLRRIRWYRDGFDDRAEPAQLDRAHLAAFTDHQTLRVDGAEPQVEIDVPIHGCVPADSQDQQEHSRMSYIAT
jgi:uncharacterized protein YfaP (DUF2135 family)